MIKNKESRIKAIIIISLTILFIAFLKPTPTPPTENNSPDSFSFDHDAIARYLAEESNFYQSREKFTVTDIGICSYNKGTLERCSIAVKGYLGNMEYGETSDTVIVNQTIYKYCPNSSTELNCMFSTRLIGNL